LSFWSYIEPPIQIRVRARVRVRARARARVRARVRAIRVPGLNLNPRVMHKPHGQGCVGPI